MAITSAFATLGPFSPSPPRASAGQLVRPDRVRLPDATPTPPASGNTCGALAAAVAGIAVLSKSSRSRRRPIAVKAERDYTGRFGGTEKVEDSAARGSVESAALEATAGKSAARWSILSERIEGVAKELFCLIGGLDPYIASVSTAEGPMMHAIKNKMDHTDWNELWERQDTMFSYGQEMSTDPIEAQTIKMFTFMKGAKRVLEVGMFAGYGSAAILEALPSDGECVSLDIDPFLKGWVSDVLSKFPGSAKHSIVTGPAIDSMLELPAGEKFDLVFIDANKSEYKRYVEILLERDLLADEGIIVCDNILYNGMPYLPAQYDTQPKRRGFADDVRDLNEWLANHPQLMQVILPIRDGVSLVRKR